MEAQPFFAGPTLGKENEPLIYCLDSDESSVIIPEEKLSEQAKDSDKEYVESNTAFTLSLLATAKKQDHLILDEKFQCVPNDLEWQKSIYKKLSLDITENIYFAPSKQFAPLQKSLLKEKRSKPFPRLGTLF